ncbi:MAG: thermonuclease family protein [Desulfobacteraceae bacterium]
MNRLIKSIFILSAATLVFLKPVHALDHITGKAVNIADGDTITVLQKEKEYKIRLYGICTPERNQPFGKKAEKFTADMIGMKQVVVDPLEKNRDGRIVGLVYIDGDGECLNEEILRAGYARVCQYCCRARFCEKWLEIEKWAREKEKGLWQDNSAGLSTD